MFVSAIGAEIDQDKVWFLPFSEKMLFEVRPDSGKLEPFFWLDRAGITLHL